MQMHTQKAQLNQTKQNNKNRNRERESASETTAADFDQAYVHAKNVHASKLRERLLKPKYLARFMAQTILN